MEDAIELADMLDNETDVKTPLNAYDNGVDESLRARNEQHSQP